MIIDVSIVFAYEHEISNLFGRKIKGLLLSLFSILSVPLKEPACLRGTVVIHGYTVGKESQNCRLNSRRKRYSFQVEASRAPRRARSTLSISSYMIRFLRFAKGLDKAALPREQNVPRESPHHRRVACNYDMPSWPRHNPDLPFGILLACWYVALRSRDRNYRNPRSRVHEW